MNSQATALSALDAVNGHFSFTIGLRVGLRVGDVTGRLDGAAVGSLFAAPKVLTLGGSHSLLPILRCSEKLLGLVSLSVTPMSTHSGQQVTGVLKPYNINSNGETIRKITPPTGSAGVLNVIYLIPLVSVSDIVATLGLLEAYVPMLLQLLLNKAILISLLSVPLTATSTRR